MFYEPEYKEIEGAISGTHSGPCVDGMNKRKARDKDGGIGRQRGREREEGRKEGIQ